MFAFRVCSGVSCFFISSSCPGILGELPDPGSHPAVQPGPLAGPPVDADQRSIGHQWLERRHRFRAEVCGLQPGGDSEEDPVHPDVRGIHRPQITQVCPAATVWNLRVGLQTFFFFFIPRPVSLLSNVFILGLQFLFLPFFWNFYILYMNLYILHTCLNILIFLCLIRMKTKEKNGGGIALKAVWLGRLGHGCVRVCMCVYARVSFCVNTITRSFSVWDAVAKHDGNIQGFWHPCRDIVVHGTDGRTDKPLRTAMVWLGFSSLKPDGGRQPRNKWISLSQTKLDAFDKKHESSIRLCIKCTFMYVSKWKEYA